MCSKSCLVVPHLWIFLAFILSISKSEDSVNAIASKKIVCCFSSGSFYRGKFTPEMITPSMCTHINYDFATLNGQTYQINYGDQKVDIGQNYYERVVALKKGNSSLKILLSMGGWYDSTKKYSRLVADVNKRAHFITTAIPFLQEHGFDGLDIAWEYPNCWQGNCGVNPADVPNFATFLKELREAFNETSLLLTASVSPIKEQVDHAYDVRTMSDVLDHINVMTYDMHGGWEQFAGHHAQFLPHPGDVKSSLNVNASVSHWIYKGADRSKLIVGIPSYGRSLTLASLGNTGLYAPITGPGRAGPETNFVGLFAFHELCQNYSRWTQHEHPLVGSYAVKYDQWVGYDSPKMAMRKSRYVLHNNLGGAVYKGFDTDDYKGACFGSPFPILRSIEYGLSSAAERDFETTETDMQKFMEKIQLSILIDENKSTVDEEKGKFSDASDGDIIITLTETETTNSGVVEIKEVKVNAGTLTATGDQDLRTLARMQNEFAVE